MLLGVETNNKRRNIDNLFSNAKRKRGSASAPSLGSRYIEKQLKPIPDVSLSDQDTGVVDALRQTQLENACLQPSL